MILYPERARQVIDYSNVLCKEGHITDIDGVFEWHDIGWLYLECKRPNVKLPTGQKLMYERRVKADKKAGKLSCVIVFDNNEDDASKICYAENCNVRECYLFGQGWRKVTGLTVRQFAEKFKEKVNEFERKRKTRGT